MSFPRSISRDTACSALTTAYEVQFLDGRAYYRSSRPERHLLVESRIESVELLHLAASSPPEIAVARVPQVGVADRPELREWKVRKTPLARQILFYVAMALIPVVIFGLLLLIAKH